MCAPAARTVREFWCVFDGFFILIFPRDRPARCVGIRLELSPFKNSPAAEGGVVLWFFDTWIISRSDPFKLQSNSIVARVRAGSFCFFCRSVWRAFRSCIFAVRKGKITKKERGGKTSNTTERSWMLRCSSDFCTSFGCTNALFDFNFFPVRIEIYYNGRPEMKNLRSCPFSRFPRSCRLQFVQICRKTYNYAYFLFCPRTEQPDHARNARKSSWQSFRLFHEIIGKNL